MDHRHLGPELNRLVDRVVASYGRHANTNHLDREFLPSRQRTLRICDLLLELTFPGYIGRRGLTEHNIRYHVGELLPDLWEALAAEIESCLCSRAEIDASLPDDGGRACAEDAARRATRFIELIPEIRALISLDVQAHYDGDPAALDNDEIIVAYPGVLAITLQRYAHALYVANVPYLPRMMCETAHQRTGIDIHPGARIGKSFCIDHGTGVVIGETTEIGDFVKIYQGVTLGALSFPKDARGNLVRNQKRHPTVGDNVTIYANAIVLGGDTVIGDGAVVGGSVFLTRSVAAGHQVSLTPPELRIRPPQSAAAPTDWSDYII